MATVKEVFEGTRYLFSPIPPVDSDFVCEFCLGPVAGYSQCFACNKLFREYHPLPPGSTNLGLVPSALHSLIIPITSALNPSPYYTWLSTYKAGHPDRGLALVALIFTYMTLHAQRLETLLGGPHDMLTTVPSKRPGRTFANQPFVLALRRLQPIAAKLKYTLTYRANSQLGRRQYNPDAFDSGPESVSGSRVVLLEDTWVTGATSVSAAGALLRDGALSVAVLPVARVVNETFVQSDHPYRVSMTAAFDPESWPR